MNKRYLTDSHFHSSISIDSQASLMDQATAAHAIGMQEICVTDHWDVTEDEAAPDLAQWEKIYFETKERIPKGLALNFGIEIGEGHRNLPLLHSVLQNPNFDLVIGSVHSLNTDKGWDEIHPLANTCKSQEDVVPIMEYYMEALEDQCRHPHFDTMAHLGYPLRYFNKSLQVSFDPYLDRLVAVLESLIKLEKSLELNTTQGNLVEENRWLFSLYHDLGGKMVTVGSDAHRTNSMSLGVAEGYDLLQSLGFQTVTVYRGRTPHQVPI